MLSVVQNLGWLPIRSMLVRWVPKTDTHWPAGGTPMGYGLRGTIRHGSIATNAASRWCGELLCPDPDQSCAGPMAGGYLGQERFLRRVQLCEHLAGG